VDRYTGRANDRGAGTRRNEPSEQTALALTPHGINGSSPVGEVTGELVELWHILVAQVVLGQQLTDRLDQA
jgi:hypothetical protein